MEQITRNGTTLSAWTDGRIAVSRAENCWREERGGSWVLLPDGERVSFSEFQVQMYPWKSGVGEGFRWEYACERKGLRFEQFAWIETSTGDLRLELAGPRNQKLMQIGWPIPFAFEEKEEGCYSVLPMQQGVLLPNGWEREVQGIEPPWFYERHGYMPWIGQVRRGAGWLAIAETPWDAGYHLEHPAGGPSRIQFVFRESMGTFGYPRRIRICLVEGGYQKMCKTYRSYLRERGELKPLTEKIVQSPKLARLVGSPVIHTDIRFWVKEQAQIYDHLHPEQNDRLTSFGQRASQLRALAGRGVKKAYVHLDGWGKEGYDQLHPDMLPPCPKAGGADGMRMLAETCRSLGYLFALHDQYHDYYTDAESYDEGCSVLDCRGKHPRDCTWNGGEQTFLCGSLAEDYVRRNYRMLDQLGIPLDGAYLDVFSVIDLDECLDFRHPMTRRECADYRCRCFDFIAQRYGVVSSEEPLAGTVGHLVLCHHAPYPTAPHLNGGRERGIPVPLFHLVFHDCIFTPWDLREGESSVMPEGRSGFLYALLNGAMGYLPIEPDEDELKKAEIVSALHEKVALCEMVSHEFLDGERRQRTVFSDGTEVEVDFEQNSYRIREGHTGKTGEGV